MPKKDSGNWEQKMPVPNNKGLNAKSLAIVRQQRK